MLSSIDFYAFTVPVDRIWEDHSYRENADFAAGLLEAKFFPGMDMFEWPGQWKSEKGRGFYFWRLRHVLTDLCISFGGINRDIFIECAGVACQRLDSAGLLEALIHQSYERATRIDFAIDIFTDIDPLVFVAEREPGRFRNAGQLISDSGTTAYIGGRTSERMARVYRYAEPHPRSAYLRVEAEYKRDAAKMAAKLLLTHPMHEVAVYVHEPFGWLHAVWKPETIDISAVPLKATSKDKARTVQWLYGTVISSLARMEKLGAIDIEDWLSRLEKARK